METISTGYVKKLLPQRPTDMHKGQAGRVLIIAGSKGMAGAAVLAARGALYSGAGLVKVAVPDEIMTILQVTVPEAMCVDRKTLRPKDFAQYDAIAIGPGIGVNENSMELIECILESYTGPVVIDADAISCIARYGVPASGRNSGKITEKNPNDVFSECRAGIVMTPHPGEADRLLKAMSMKTFRRRKEESCVSAGVIREDIAKAIAAATGATVLLKGAGTIIACPCGKTAINSTGNPGMATGGSGDVLTGMIAALLAGKYLGDEHHDGLEPFEAVCAGAFLHGLAGDIAAENIGEYGMTAADIADAVSVAFREIQAD